MTPLAARVLAAIRTEVGRRAGAGGPPGALDADRLAALVEADPACRRDLERAVAAARREFAYDAPPDAVGPRAERRARLDRALAAIDELLVLGELAPDGPGRVVLPGFGPATWRALGVLRAGAIGPEGRWARAVAALPLADLGDAAPPDLREGAPDPGLREVARRLLARQAERQDLRDALIRAGAAARHAAGRGLRDSLESIERDAALLTGALTRADADIEALWDAGLRRARAPEALDP